MKNVFKFLKHINKVFPIRNIPLGVLTCIVSQAIVNFIDDHIQKAEMKIDNVAKSDIPLLSTFAQLLIFVMSFSLITRKLSWAIIKKEVNYVVSSPYETFTTSKITIFSLLIIAPFILEIIYIIASAINTYQSSRQKNSA